MKTQFVARLQEGDTVNDHFLAARKDLRTQNNGGKFLGMVFRDRTGEVGGILWNNAESVSALFEVGDVVNVRGSVTTYQGRLQIRVDQVLPLRDEDYERADLVASPTDGAEDMAKFRAILDTIEDEWLKKLVGLFLDDEGFVAGFTGAAAGKKWHHAYPGGLVRHCCEIARIALTVCELFPNINRDVLLTGVLLHDAGKLEEMSHDLFVDYTTAGKLLGHLHIGADMAQRKMDSIEGFPETLRLSVLHCILAHHGELVNGSPVVPKTLEAMVLYHCDNLDAQADALTRVIQETQDGRKEWSDYLPLIERQVWARRE
ncbi:MAG: HD domain-containing protein [Nitrospiraceae bacterium]|nr:HD domain-containing protein [Nitrospiraceae bacterium]